MMKTLAKCTRCTAAFCICVCAFGLGVDIVEQIRHPGSDASEHTISVFVGPVSGGTSASAVGASYPPTMVETIVGNDSWTVSHPGDLLYLWGRGTRSG